MDEHDEMLALLGGPYRITGNPGWPGLKARLDAMGATWPEFLRAVSYEAGASKLVPGFLVSPAAFELFARARETQLAENEMRCQMQRRRVLTLLREGRTPDDIASDGTECLCAVLRYFLARMAESPDADALKAGAKHEDEANPDLTSKIVGWDPEWQEYLTELRHRS
jgi:hypothetical protein